MAAAPTAQPLGLAPGRDPPSHTATDEVGQVAGSGATNGWEARVRVETGVATCSGPGRLSAPSAAPCRWAVRRGSSARPDRRH